MPRPSPLGCTAPAWPAPRELEVERLGPCLHPSPLPAERCQLFVDDGSRVLLPSDAGELEPFLAAGEVRPPSFEPAGPRERIFFDPHDVGAGIVTCGGLCPGLNNVVRAIVLHLTCAYGVRRILGFRYGYAGLAPASPLAAIDLTPEMVGSWQELGGTKLGSSRGPQDPADMVDTLLRLGIHILFVVGGDGGLSGASVLSAEIGRRGVPIAVVGVPKTIDNDLDWTVHTFGFDTAVAAADAVLLAAHAEAEGAWNGVGLVKLMGRHSGFIAAHATLASAYVDLCLVPEVPFTLEGDGGLLQILEERLDRKGHAVVVAAEGAGQELVAGEGPEERDASGNVRLKDIGVFLRDRIAAHQAGRGRVVNIRYIDPSYTIRSQPANSRDARLCLALGQHAVHAAMAGRTNVMIGLWNHRFTHVPIPLAVRARKRIDPYGEVWQRVLETTGQPASMVGG